MSRPLSAREACAAAALIFTAGCGPNLVGAGDPDRLHADHTMCAWGDRPWYG